MTVKLYGIPQCDTIRKARRWLREQDIDHLFHDFRKDGLSAAQLQRWIKLVGWEPLLNRRGTSWRQLPEHQREGIDARRAEQLMLAQPTLIKRPVLETATGLEIGFSVERYQSLFK